MSSDPKTTTTTTTTNGNTNQPLFSLDTTRYDLSTYLGRVRHFFSIFNPLLIFTTDKQLAEARNLLTRYKNNEIPQSQLQQDPKLNESLWNAKKITDAIIHPQTNEKIPLPFRLSAFVPMSLPIATGMLLSTSQMSGLFWQWYNQSVNVCMNFSNGNKTNPMPPSKIAKAYTIAVLSSCGVHYGLNQTVLKYSGTMMKRVGHGTFSVLVKIIPYTAVVSAGTLNVFVMRFNEIDQGIEVCDKSGNVVGISKKAGKLAILQTVTSRAVLPMPILLIPPIIVKGIERTKFMQARPKLTVPLNLAVISLCLWGALPLAIGLFPQQSSISPMKLEPQFHNYKEKHLYFNKGL